MMTLLLFIGLISFFFAVDFLQYRNFAAAILFFIVFFGAYIVVAALVTAAFFLEYKDVVQSEVYIAVYFLLIGWVLGVIAVDNYLDKYR